MLKRDAETRCIASLPIKTPHNQSDQSDEPLYLTPNNHIASPIQLMTKNIQLSIDDIKHQDSAFYLMGKIVTDDFHTILAQSLSELCFLQPLLVYQDQQGAYHLLDGFSRLAIAKKQALTTVPCHILPPETALTTLLNLLLIEQYTTIQSSLIGRIDFIALALARGMDRARLCRDFLPRLDFQGHEKVLRQCEAISHLPKEVLDFCQEKNFAMRQCLALTRQPKTLLQEVMTWREQLNLTASIIEELLSHINDLLRSRAQDMATFMASKEIAEILNSEYPKQEKTRLLRQLLKNWRYPILSEAQNNLQTIYQHMPLPEETLLKWDESLERHELTLQLKARSVNEWQQRIGALQNQSVIEGVEQLLRQL
ncbi:MAG: hypothetical protein DRR00_23140 [Candidatus Parabeggiatoa sp. nov. 3]|nr:MAG: hypothetical protein DRR00_23140 [Gammaproteobacteria bacterium]RKZ63685.1 MAG: hypothetical protein DRQ99_16755 [Gammaproteobacteria bacterium]